MSQENAAKETKAVEMRKKKVLLTFNPPVAIPLDGETVVFTHSAVAEIEVTEGRPYDDEMPKRAVILGLGDGRTLKKSRRVKFGYSTVSAMLDYDEA